MLDSRSFSVFYFSSKTWRDFLRCSLVDIVNRATVRTRKFPCSSLVFTVDLRNLHGCSLGIVSLINWNLEKWRSIFKKNVTEESEIFNVPTEVFFRLSLADGQLCTEFDLCLLKPAFPNWLLVWLKKRRTCTHLWSCVSVFLGSRRFLVRRQCCLLSFRLSVDAQNEFHSSSTRLRGSLERTKDHQNKHEEKRN